MSSTLEHTSELPSVCLDVKRFQSAPSQLKRLLVSLDFVAIMAAWAIPMAISTPTRHLDASVSQFVFFSGHATLSVLYFALGVFFTFLATAGLHLYRTRSREMRTEEIVRTFRATPSVVLVSLVLSKLTGESRLAFIPLLTGLLYFAFLNLSRMCYRSYLISARRRGHRLRKILLVGSSRQARSLEKHFEERPELGFTVSGIVGSEFEAKTRRFTAPYLGRTNQLGMILQATGATGALIAQEGTTEEEFNQSLRTLLQHRVYTRVATGIRGIDHRRLTSHSLGYEPMMYIEPIDLAGWQAAVKRVIDLAIASTVLLVSAPVIALAALAIWLTDRGPVFFRQSRVGRNGTHFEMIKLRSMVVDAELRLVDLTAHNARKGPLFKLHNDPRVTLIGKIIRATSIDELPQLWNVIRGDMSLVGPRPALPAEVEQFSETLRMRHNVLPGITGLWQVEARDDPDFSSYEKLDVFYVENWSVLLDLSILVATARVVIVRALRALTKGRALAMGTRESAVMG